MFMPLCPTYHYIDRADANYARAMAFEKDYAAILSAAWDLDTAIDQYLKYMDEETSDVLHVLGLDEGADDDRSLRIRKLIDSNLTKGSFKERYQDPFEHYRDRIT